MSEKETEQKLKKYSVKLDRYFTALSKVEHLSEELDRPLASDITIDCRKLSKIRLRMGERIYTVNTEELKNYLESKKNG